MKKEKKQKREPYRIVMSKFVGSTEDSYTYEITFNKSMVHTGKWRGIEKGLNDYDRKEPFNNFVEHVKGAFVSLWYGLRYLFS